MRSMGLTCLARRPAGSIFTGSSGTVGGVLKIDWVAYVD